MKVAIGLYSEYEVWRLPEEPLQFLKAEFLGVSFVPTDSDEAFARELEDAEIALCWALTPEQFGKEKRLRWVQSTAAGVGKNLFPEMVKSDVLLTNASGVHAIPISEHVIGLMLSLSRKLHLAMRLQIERKWREESIVNIPDLPGEMFEKTFGIIGLGAIGRAVAERAKALGMQVIGTRKNWKRSENFVDQLLPPEQMDTLLSQSDVVVVACPLTEETKGLIGKEQLRKMKPTAFLINIARGKIIDEQALIRALKESWIRGAGLDVFEEEPLPEASELWGLPNVVITPHVAGATPKYWARVANLFADNLRRFLDGQPLLNVVDKKLGY